MKTIELRKRKSKRYLPYFLREIEYLQRLDSPNLVKVEDIFSSTTHIDIVMEYMDLGTMKSYISRKRLTQAEVAWSMYQIILGVRDLHLAGLIHCDLSLNNILLKSGAGDGYPITKVADLGLAEEINRNKKEEKGRKMGNSLNAAPELLRQQEYDHMTDLWSCGMLCYEMLTGQHPFRHIDAGQLAFELGVVGKVPFPTSLWSKFSEDAKDFTTKLLTTDPSTRMTTTEALEHPFLSRVKNYMDSSSSSMRTALSQT